MLSAAKHLSYLVEYRREQILRFVQNDLTGGSFIRVPGSGLRRLRHDD